VTADQAAQDAVNAYCTRAEACAPAFVKVAFGDVMTCEQGLKAGLLAAFTAPGTSTSPAQTEACAQAIPQTSCADLLARKNPTACATLPGQLSAGAACGNDAQCTGTRCQVAADALCGTCTSPAAAGGPCGVDADCQSGMKCLGQICVTYGNEGTACGANAPCRPDLGCVGGACGRPSPLGAACMTSPECAQLQGDFCHPVSLTCTAAAFSQPGGPCGLVGNQGLAAAQVVLCAGPGGVCQGLAAPTYTGTCVGAASAGASCVVDGGAPQCGLGAVCSGGTCQSPNPSACK
jgi:hypothetical protein